MKTIKIGGKSLKVAKKINSRDELKNQKNKSGISLWYNNITKEYYIGSSINLCNRLNHYYYPSRLNSNQRINRAILKYGHDNFYYKNNW